ncbi:aminotransferase class IV [Haloparvum sp. AD34]
MTDDVAGEANADAVAGEADADAVAGEADADEAALRFNVDGEVVPADEATVDVRDRGFMYGDAAFETMRAYGGDVFRWEAHADRLRNTCETLQLDHGLSDATLRSRIDETLAANDLAEAYVKLSISRGVQPGKLDPDPDVDPTVVVYVSPLPRGGVDGEAVWDGPATLQTTKTRRASDRAIPSDAKTHNYLNGILARLELRTSDADEALMLDDDGHVAEGATSNLFFVDGTALRTPSLDGPVLPGITRDVVIDLAAKEGIPVEEGQYAPADVREADEVFLTNSTWEIRPVTTVDGIDVGPEPAAGSDGDDNQIGPVTKLLSRLFDERIETNFYD